MEIRGSIIKFSKDFQTKCSELAAWCEESVKNEGKRVKEILPALLYAYFYEMVNYVLDLEEDNFSPMKAMELEQWLLAVSADGMKDFENLDYSLHPVRLMNEWYLELTGEKSRKEYADDELAVAICEDVVKSKYLERKKMEFCVFGKDYKLTEDDRFMPYLSYGSLAQIQDIRIITKIKNILKEKNMAKVAIFGTLKKEKNYFKEFFRDKNTEIENFIFLQEDLFRSPDSEYVVNLKNPLDIMYLVKNYNLILFLDESYFYKPFQSHKSFIEENYARYIKILFQRINVEKLDDISKINIYYTLYETTKKFLACKNKPMSPQYEFDAELIKQFEALVNSYPADVADIYFYIHNDRIEDTEIEIMNVCKEENYDGKNLNVYKISGRKSQVVLPVVSSKMNTARMISVDLWKLIKSVSNRYYTEKWSKYSIDELMTTQVIFRIGKKEKDDKELFVIEYTIGESEKEELRNATKRFMQSFCNIIAGEGEIGCIKRYLVNMLSNAFLSRAISVECALMAYWTAHKEKLVFNYVSKEHWGGIEDLSDDMPYRERKQLYTIIEKLNRLMVRDMDQLQLILFMEFKNSYAKDMENEKFRQYIKEIHEVCERLGEKESRLYVCTNIE